MKKGISLIALTATIVIMIILISTVTISGINTANNSRKQAFATELATIQEAVNAYKISTNGEYPTSNSILVNTQNLSTDVLENQFNGEEITDNTLILQEIDYTKIGITSLKYGYKKDGDADVYAISTITNKVYYVKGIKIGANTYFTLTDELKNMIEYNIGTGSDLVQEGIIFTPTTTEWTNQNVDVIVKVPEEYTSVGVTANGSTIALVNNQDGYGIYNITSITGRYNIKVTYTRDGQSREAIYNVDNVDSESPIISLKDDNSDSKPDQVLMQNEETGNSYAYMSITSKTDDISGVKIVKYENESIATENIGQYFATSGKTAYNDIVPITKNIQYMTVYIEDYAGNYSWINNIKIEDSVYSGLLAGPNSENVPIKIANAPVLAQGMTPIKWDTSGNIATTTQTDRDWYNYADKKWANAQTADGSMWVWIPRYAYKIDHPHTSTAETINIVFSQGTTTTIPAGYTVHPAFTFGDAELTGIWVAKFEASGTAGAVDIKPAITSLRNISVGAMFDACRNMETNNRYGWGTEGTEIDTHLMKNIEWGAVAYLTQSIYGKNDEVWINPNSDYITGQAGTGVSAGLTTTTYPYNNTEYGINASTTGNTYGIYDISGGAWEYVAAYVSNEHEYLSTYGGNLTATGTDEKYRDAYISSGDTQTGNYIASVNKIGCAVYETSANVDSVNSAWYGDHTYMPYSGAPFFVRSGGNNYGSLAGAFAFSYDYGGPDVICSFRPVLAVSSGI